MRRKGPPAAGRGAAIRVSARGRCRRVSRRSRRSPIASLASPGLADGVVLRPHTVPAVFRRCQAERRDSEGFRFTSPQPKAPERRHREESFSPPSLFLSLPLFLLLLLLLSISLPVSLSSFARRPNSAAVQIAPPGKRLTTRVFRLHCAGCGCFFEAAEDVAHRRASGLLIDMFQPIWHRTGAS